MNSQGESIPTTAAAVDGKGEGQSRVLGFSGLMVDTADGVVSKFDGNLSEGEINAKHKCKQRLADVSHGEDGGVAEIYWA